MSFGRRSRFVFLVSNPRLIGGLSEEVTVFSKPLVYFLTNTSIFKAQETSVEKGLSGGKSLFIGTAILCKSETFFVKKAG